MGRAASLKRFSACGSAWRNFSNFTLMAEARRTLPVPFQIALFKGPQPPIYTLYIPHIPLPFGHSVDTNEATMDPTPEDTPCWQDQYHPREICCHWSIWFDLSHFDLT